MHDDPLKTLLQRYEVPPTLRPTMADVRRRLAARSRSTTAGIAFGDWAWAGYTMALSVLIAVAIGVFLGYGAPSGVFGGPSASTIGGPGDVAL